MDFDVEASAYLFDRNQVRFTIDDTLLIQKFMKEFETKSKEKGLLKEWARQQNCSFLSNGKIEQLYSKYLWNKTFSKYWELVGKRILVSRFPSAKFGNLNKTLKVGSPQGAEVNGAHLAFKSTDRHYFHPVLKRRVESYTLQYATYTKNSEYTTRYGQDPLFQLPEEEWKNHFIAAGWVNVNEGYASLRGIWRWDFLKKMGLIEDPIFVQNQRTKKAIYLDSVRQKIVDLHREIQRGEQVSQGVWKFQWPTLPPKTKQSSGTRPSQLSESLRLPNNRLDNIPSPTLETSL